MITLPDKFFVESTDSEEILLVTKERSFWWVQFDYTHEDYDSCYDTSGTMSEESLLQRIQSDEYRIIPDDEGWIELDDL
ncbi:hypothetical protein [Peribacillus loiseleuriae]|uniref:Uncharacterized protein n=1 Tax=Peribacillus loiseleuriae TaxID=1679170 RepID=A0A0K9GSH0_9BACI|nr:hypothetical protein [Peribacillus loiseleuriae]KMY49556.1 hypothetical protein AC625_08355 [Peribacillus loiseleuriae]